MQKVSRRGLRAKGAALIVSMPYQSMFHTFALLHGASAPSLRAAYGRLFACGHLRFATVRSARLASFALSWGAPSAAYLRAPACTPSCCIVFALFASFVVPSHSVSRSAKDARPIRQRVVVADSRERESENYFISNA
jgi:hypothetical protein